VALCVSLPKRFTGVHDPIMGVTFDPTCSALAADPVSETPQSRWALFWGATWICKVPFEGAYHSGSTHKKRKSHSRQRDSVVETGEPTHDGFRMITHYRSLLNVDFLSNGELVVIERPLVDVLVGLPPPFFRYKYNAT
jgi:U3 small nucleolar RNA-associated protein 4